tara:strand:+ start:5082 stop:6086 length:1005 start_codon:yes stop_codon:yes gene_type:complete
MTGTGVQNMIVREEDNDTRIDKWFWRHFPGLGKGMLYKLMRKGQVRLDSGRVKPDTRVYTGNVVRVPPMPADAYQPRGEKSDEMSATEKSRARDKLKEMTIFEDRDVLILNKPYGLATQGGSKVKNHVDGMLRALENDKVQPKLVHRLDRETSGVLIVAKNAAAARNLGKSLKHRDAQKYYWAIVAPAPELPDGVIEARIAKGAARGGEYMMVNDEDGKYSKTEYQVVERAWTKAAWLMMQPETGRTHQLRIHAQLMGCPIIGDSKYGPEEPIIIEDLDNVDKLHLHARRLIIPHPSGKGMIDVYADLPKHMVESFKFFGFHEHVAEAFYEDGQ